MTIFISFSKKNNDTKCEDHRKISLIGHGLEVLLNIYSRIYRRLEKNITETQFGFMNALGTREALSSIQVLIKRDRDFNCDVYAC